jgi:hypothetical protein
LKLKNLRKLFIMVAALFFTGIAHAAPDTSAHRAQFEFHSSFLMNLHSFLLDAAKHKGKLQSEAWQLAPTDAEMKVLSEIVAFYQANYVTRDALFDESMIEIKIALSVADDSRQDVAGLDLPADLSEQLRKAAPIYARCLWLSQDKINRDWIDQIKVLDTRYGAEIQAGVEHYLAHEFPTGPVREDVVVADGEWAGAYTTSEPMQTVISSGNPGYQGLAALEMLYHESSHIHVTDTVRDVIADDLKARGQPPESALWHAVQFYTVGEVTREVLKRRGNIDYQPFALKNGVYTHGVWAAYLTLIQTSWVQYMRGDIDMHEALIQMVDKLPST